MDAENPKHLDRYIQVYEADRYIRRYQPHQLYAAGMGDLIAAP